MGGYVSSVGDSGYTGAGTRNEKTRVWDGESFLSPSE